MGGLGAGSLYLGINLLSIYYLCNIYYVIVDIQYSIGYIAA